LVRSLKEIEMASGTVKFFNSQKGFGFIEQDGGGPDVFVHVSAVERAGMRGLAEGQKLQFDIEADRKSGKSAATNLQTAWPALAGWKPGVHAPGFCMLAQAIVAQTVARMQADPSAANRMIEMARKPGTRVEFVLFDVFYEDGSRRSNRKVPSAELGGIDGDAAARAIIAEQDQTIAEKSGVPPLPIKSIRRSGASNWLESASVPVSEVRDMSRPLCG
jgi:cold shock protein